MRERICPFYHRARSTLCCYLPQVPEVREGCVFPLAYARGAYVPDASMACRAVSPAPAFPRHHKIPPGTLVI